MSAPSPIKSVKVTSNSEQDSMEVTIGNVSSSPARCVQRNSHYDVKISFHERKHHTDSYATIPPRNKKVGTDAEVSTAETEANEEDYHSDRTIIGDDLEHHDDGSEDESEKANRSADHDEEHRDLSGLIGEEPGSETHKEADNDFVDHAEKEPRSREDDEDDDGAENDSQDDSGAHKEAIQIDIYRQKKVDLKISILKERSNGLELMVQSRQPKARMMRRRRQGKLQCWGVVLQVCT